MAKKLIPVERQQQILRYLQQHGVVKSSTLMELFDASEATIRRDLEWMERHGLIEKTHGGAILIQRMQQEAIYSASASIHQQEKKWIARAAVQLVENGDMIFINNGTTTTEVFLALQNRLDLKDITVVTNNVSAAMAVQSAEFKIILLGGIFRPSSTSIVGDLANNTLRRMYANKAILGVDGVANRFGCTSPIPEEAEISRVMIDQCLGQTILVADHSKWGVIAQYRIAGLDDLDIFVCDSALPQEALDSLSETEIEIILAGADTTRTGNLTTPA
ncbi:MAG: DeoR/GlpR transcriptional regulator [Chloroflexi bacterium]|nr:DeoR/GlpR transcriptional regulator [Chloroflexota bacterium]